MKNMKRALALALGIAMLLTMECIAEGPGVIGPLPSPMATVADQGLETAGNGAGGVAPVGAVSLALEPAEVSMEYSQSVTLTATAFAGAGAVVWSSSDESVAELSATSGGSVEVVGVNEGTATITCSLGGQSRTCTVTVNAPSTLQITGVNYPSTLNVLSRGWKLRWGTLASVDDLKTLTSSIKDASGESIGEPYTHTFTGSVKRYEIKGIDNFVPFSRVTTEALYTWTLSATDAAGRSVSVDLPIQAVAAGETVVSSNPGVFAPIITAPDGAPDSKSATMKAGEIKKMTATLPSDESAGNSLVWVSYDPTVATVSSSGVITGIGTGTTTIICRTPDNSGLSAGYTVTVDGGATPVAGGSAETAATIPVANAAENSSQVGGRNLFILKDSEQGYLADDNSGTVTGFNKNGETTSNYIQVAPGDELIIQTWATSTTTDSQHYMIDYMWFSDQSPESHIGKKTRYAGGELGYNHAICKTVPAPEGAKYVRVDARLYSDGKIKVERIDKYAGWTPAPEDIDTSLDSIS